MAVTALSLPGAAIMTLAGGAIFGFAVGLLIVSFASSLGATLAFLSARFLLRDWVQQRFGDRWRPINDGIAREGAFYLFALRLVPLFPFFLVNLVMGLTPIGTGTFYWVSQLGMLRRHGRVRLRRHAARPVPRVAGPARAPSRCSASSRSWPSACSTRSRRARSTRAGRRVRPARYDHNLVVIGAGSAGLVSAYIAAAIKARVTLVEEHRMGGDCLNTGCVPSKALIRSAKLLSHIARRQGARHRRRQRPRSTSPT